MIDKIMRSTRVSIVGPLRRRRRHAWLPQLPKLFSILPSSWFPSDGVGQPDVDRRSVVMYRSSTGRVESN